MASDIWLKLMPSAALFVVLKFAVIGSMFISGEQSKRF